MTSLFRFAVVAWTSFAISAQAQKEPTLNDLLPNRSFIGPLVLTSVKDSWLSVEWSPDDAHFMRRISGLIPKRDDSTPQRIRLRSSHIGPRFDSDGTKRERFQQLFDDSLTRILANKKFWFRTVSANNNVPEITWLEGVLTFDDIGSKRLEMDLVRDGSAVVKERRESSFTESFRDDYRDQLLRLEGMARQEKKGVWADE
ncbi:MAG TPA: thermonuclease family protein [Bacteroidia bacterium]|nr:thermonuclease family protein [Bacteroidia bacterium]